MALSLSAEQKSVYDIFYNNVQYIIPDYQRSYSWGFDQCNQLYLDFISAFDEDCDFFIGNIIIARSLDERKKPQVVDGQQRLITLWLLLKALSVLCPGLKIKENFLVNVSVRRNEEDILKIESEVFETSDNEDIKHIYTYDSKEYYKRLSEVCNSKGEINESKCISRFEYVSLMFYQNLCKTAESRLEDFTSFILDHIFLLPIELTGDNMEVASNKALTIFETINNRGMSLENADIFKAKLYYRSTLNREEGIFKKLWAEFRLSTEDLGIKVDDVFRYYSHIIRGRENIVTSEKNLRDFFLLDSASPIFKNNYQETMSDLLRITEILQLLQKLESSDSVIGPWLQILDAYTNSYPRYAVVNYLFVNRAFTNEDFLIFLKKVIRYAYSLGATTNVKFEVYKIIGKTYMQLPIDEYFIWEPIENFNQYRMLRKGYSLLYYYLSGGSFMPRFWYDKLMANSDRVMLKALGWTDEQIDDGLKSIANTIVVDIPIKRKPLVEKFGYYQENGLKHPSSVFYESVCRFGDFESYRNHYNKVLNSFFFEADEKDKIEKL